MITAGKDAVRPRVPRGHKLAAVRRDDPLAPAAAPKLKRFQIVGTLPVSLLLPTARECAPWRTAMAKGQKRSNREAKKPKANKKKDLASTGTVSNALAKPKPGAATAESKK